MNKTGFLILGLVAAVMILPSALAAHSVTITNKDDAKPGTYTMTLDVGKFELRSFTGRDGQELGKGHIHYLVNGQDACAAGKANCAAPTDYATPSKSFTFTNLVAGDTIEVELVFDNHGASGASGSPPRPDGSRVLDAVEVKASTVPGFGVGPLVGALALFGLGATRLRRR